MVFVDFFKGCFEDFFGGLVLFFFLLFFVLLFEVDWFSFHHLAFGYDGGYFFM